jgi:hypothetical protein
MAHAVQREQGLLVLAIGVISVHVAYDNFLQPDPGVSARDHLLVSFAAVALLVERARGRSFQPTAESAATSPSMGGAPPTSTS